ncbi:MAG: NUDIX domain-containing protein [Minisyncoccales bacterium]
MNKKYLKDNLAHKFPVSIKGIIKNKNCFLLLKNDRQEWEFPGGKLELNELVEKCLKREIKEETGLNIIVDKFVNAWVYHIYKNVDVLILTFYCKLKKYRIPIISSEHKEAKWFSFQEIMKLKNLPQGYKKSIKQIENKKWQ